MSLASIYHLVNAGLFLKGLQCRCDAVPGRGQLGLKERRRANSLRSISMRMETPSLQNTAE